MWWFVAKMFHIWYNDSMEQNEKIQALLAKEHQLEAKLNNLVYGSPEVRGGYFYVHRRTGGRQITRYAGNYSDELYNLILKNNQIASELKKELRVIKNELRKLGYQRATISEATMRNLDFAKRNLTLTIHSQAILEGVATTFAETEAIIEGGLISGMTEKDIRKIVNMKHAWEFIMDEDVITAPDNLALVCQINKLVEEGFYFNAGKLRDVPVKIGGTKWQPGLPIESQVVEALEGILQSDEDDSKKAIGLALYVMRAQLFLDGNKRTGVIFANHYLIARGLGLLYIPEEDVEEFKKLLVEFYETDKKTRIGKFLEEKCLLKI